MKPSTTMTNPARDVGTFPSSARSSTSDPSTARRAPTWPRSCARRHSRRTACPTFMNVAIEELVRNRFELPGFMTLLKVARRGRTEFNRGLYRRVAHALGDAERAQIDRLLTVDGATRRSPWKTVREELRPGPGTHRRDGLGLICSRRRWPILSRIVAIPPFGLPQPPNRFWICPNVRSSLRHKEPARDQRSCVVWRKKAAERVRHGDTSCTPVFRFTATKPLRHPATASPVAAPQTLPPCLRPMAPLS